MNLFFWRKKEEIFIRCSACGWQDDSEKHWQCSCGHVWNTFQTKGKCPACKIQWQETWCPACRTPTPHRSWYKTKDEIDAIERSLDPALLVRKKRVENRLINYGITMVRIKHLPYLDNSNMQLHTPYEAGCRMLVLLTMSYCAQQLDDRAQACEWLHEEKLWDRVSPSEKNFLLSESVNVESLPELMWGIEGALALGWCLNKVEKLPPLDMESEEALNELMKNIPAIGDSTMLFLTNLEFRSWEDIFEENILNELITGFFRDLFLSAKPDPTAINRAISFERHKVLNWLSTQYEDGNGNPGELWDEVDTST